MVMVSRHSWIVRTGVLLVAIPVAFQLAALAYLFKVQRDAAIAERWELHSKDVLGKTDDLAYALSQAHSALRAASYFENSQFEAERRGEMDVWPRMLDELTRLVSDNPSQQEKAARIRRASQPYLEWFREMERLAAADRWAGFTGILRSGRGKQLLDTLESSIKDFQNEEERLDAVRRADALATRQREWTVLLGIVIVSIAMAAAVLVMFVRGLSSRLGHVSINGERLATGEPLLDALAGKDEVAALDAVLHDSASRLAKAAQAERRHTEELEARRRALERANSDLTFRTQENEMFVYSVSHDLRSPLVNVQGFTNELVRGCDTLRKRLAALPVSDADRHSILDLVEQDIVESVGFIQTAVSRLSGIVDALLRLSRAGRVQLSSQPVDLSDVVSRIVSAMRMTIVERGAEVTVGPLPTVVGDPVAIEQVLANLVGNALNYLDPGRPGRVQVGMRTQDRDGTATVYVRDNGQGIPERYLSKLFVPFERLHGNAVKGEGVGLALAKRIVDRLGGRIWAESTEGQGTTFFVTLRKPATRPAGIV